MRLECATGDYCVPCRQSVPFRRLHRLPDECTIDRVRVDALRAVRAVNEVLRNCVSGVSCGQCRRSVSFRESYELPEVCPAGITEQDVTDRSRVDALLADLKARLDKTAHPEPQHIDTERRSRTTYLCIDVVDVVSWRSCCGGNERALIVQCDHNGVMPWATCLTCESYRQSDRACKRKR